MTLEEGSVIGDHCIVNENARVRSQVKIWPDKQIESGAVVGTSLIWGSQGRRALFGRFGVTGLVNIDLTRGVLRPSRRARTRRRCRRARRSR